MWFSDIYVQPPTATGISGETPSKSSSFGISGEKNFSNTKSFTISGESSK